MPRVPVLLRKRSIQVAQKRCSPAGSSSLREQARRDLRDQAREAGKTRGEIALYRAEQMASTVANTEQAAAIRAAGQALKEKLDALDGAKASTTVASLIRRARNPQLKPHHATKAAPKPEAKKEEAAKAPAAPAAKPAEKPAEKKA